MRASYRQWFADVSSTRPDNYAPPRIDLGRDDENPVILTRQDWRHFQGQPWGGGSNGQWLLHLKRPLTVSMQLHLTQQSARPQIVRVMNGKELIKTIDSPSRELIIEDITLAHGDVDLWFELLQGENRTGPYQVHIRFQK